MTKEGAQCQIQYWCFVFHGEESQIILKLLSDIAHLAFLYYKRMQWAKSELFLWAHQPSELIDKQSWRLVIELLSLISMVGEVIKNIMSDICLET